jgi:hypothetical protein
MAIRRVRCAILVGGAGLLAACGGTGPALTPTPTPSGPPATTAPASPTAPPTVSPPPTATPSPPLSACLPLQGGTGARSAITDMRAGAHTGYDRLVLEFDGAVPTWSMTANGGMTFSGGGRGEPIELDGAYGVRLDLRGVNWTSDRYAHGTDLAVGYTVLREARVVGDFEGIVNIGIGLSRQVCPTVSVLTGPVRLVIDFSTAHD